MHCTRPYCRNFVFVLSDWTRGKSQRVCLGALPQPPAAIRRAYGIQATTPNRWASARKDRVGGRGLRFCLPSQSGRKNQLAVQNVLVRNEGLIT